MDSPIYLLFGLMAAMILFQIFMSRLAKRAVGQPAPDTTTVDGEAHNMRRRVYYFYATHCGPCRAMTPIVDQMRATHPNLIKINIDDSLEIAQGFRIAGTPSLVLVEEGLIRQVLLGAQSENKLKHMLEATA